MARFEELNNNINNVMMKLIESQNLCKLLHYNDENPLMQDDIADTSGLIFTKIFPLPKVPDSSSEATSVLSVVFDNFRLGGNTGVKEGILKFTAICHIDLWKTSGSLRPISILSEVDKIFNDERIVGIKKLQLDRGNLIWVNDKYIGYQISYQMVSVN